MLGDLSTGAGAEEFVHWLFAKLREDYLESNELRPRAWVFLQCDPTSGEKLEQTAIAMIVAPDFRGGNREKDALVAMIREIALKSKAVGVVMAMEVWVASKISKERVRSLGPRGLEALPEAERSEALYISLDHLGFKASRSWSAAIRRDSDGSPRLEDFCELPIVEQEGRFSNLFPRELWQ